MASRHWLKLTLFVTLLVTAIGAGANAYVDIFGLWRDPSNRTLPVYGDERIAKYLLSTKYVEQNYEGLLIGSSMSGNWKVGSMKSTRLYNESINGGNIAEEKVLLDRVLEHPTYTPKMVLIVVHPYLTASHDFKTVTLTPREVWGSLGSHNLIEAYKGMLKVRMGSEKKTFDGAGSEDFGEDKVQKLNANLQAIWKPGSEFAVDPIGRQRFDEAVAAVHAKHIPLVYVVPPTMESLLTPKEEEFGRYKESFLATRLPEDKVIDFSSEEFAAFRSEPLNFSDGVHLRARGSVQVTSVIDERIGAWIAQGWLKQGS